MKKLLMGFGAAALLAAGCSQPGAMDAAPDSFAAHKVYVVTADCGNASCPYPAWPRYVFVTRNEADARQRFLEITREMVQANPESNAMATAQSVATGKLPNKLYSWSNGISFTVNIDISYL